MGRCFAHCALALDLQLRRSIKRSGTLLSAEAQTFGSTFLIHQSYDMIPNQPPTVALKNPELFQFMLSVDICIDHSGAHGGFCIGRKAPTRVTAETQEIALAAFIS
jgi:hypothetical protein